MIENHVERCHCWECGGYGKKEYTEAVPDPIRGGDLVGVFDECDGCDGDGELLRAKLTQTTVIRYLGFTMVYGCSMSIPVNIRSTSMS